MDEFASDDDFDVDDYEDSVDAFDEDDEFTETVACPSCGADVYEDAVQCPRCGEYITHSSNVWSDRPWWWIVLGLAGILAVIVALSVAGTLGG